MKLRFIIPLFLISFGMTFWGLASNEQQAETMKRGIMNKDAAAEPVGEEIDELYRFSSYHMNAEVSFTLAGKFERDLEAAQQKAAQSNGDPALYTRAQEHCDRFQSSPTALVSCVEQFLAENSASGSNPGAITYPDPTQYVYSFRSPSWSQDLAGYGLVAIAVTAVLSLIMVPVSLLRKD